MSFLPKTYELIDCRANKCPKHPTGKRYRGVRKCSGCSYAFYEDGKPFTHPDGWAPSSQRDRVCPTCHGEKTLILMTLDGGRATCPKCNGTGILPKRRKFSVVDLFT